MLNDENLSLHSTIVAVLGTLIYYKEPTVLSHLGEISTFVLHAASNSSSEELHDSSCMLFCDLAQVLREELGKSDGFGQIIEVTSRFVYIRGNPLFSLIQCLGIQ